MTRFASRLLLATGGLSALLSALTPATAQSNGVPNLQSGPGGWTHPFGGDFPSVQGSASPVHQDPGHRFVNAQANFRIGDVSNPNLKPWARDLMKKDNDEVDAGKVQFSANSSCVPSGIPMLLLMAGPFYVLQTPTKVVIVEQQTQQARHVYLNVPHMANIKPSWFGDSVGYYEGDTLVIDTVGLNTRTFVDYYGTPHGEKLHVVERWHLIDGGNMLEVNLAVEDPDTFYWPWRSYQRYQRGQRPMGEEICSENNTNLFDYHMPVADKPDF
jgi:hypothetical protein